jgi:inosose dehydratase
VNNKLACSVLHYDIAKYDYYKAIENIAELGYEGVELHPLPSQTKDDSLRIRNLLERLELKPASVSCQKYSWAGRSDSDKTRETIEAFKESVLLAEYLETDRVLTETGAVPKEMDRELAFKLAAENIASACDFASAHGIKTVLLESVPPPFNYVVDNSERFLEFCKLSGASNLYANIDASNYLMAGENPSSALRSLGQLVKGIHIKDGMHVGGQWTPIGEGEVNWHEFLLALNEIRYEGWLVVEYEGSLTGKYYLDPERASRDSLEFLRKTIRETS